MNEKFTKGKWQANPELGNVYSLDTSSTAQIAIVQRMKSITAISREEYEANLRLITNAPALYSTLLQLRPFFSRAGYIHKEIENLLREINPDFDKYPEATDIKAFAESVKNMRDWQKEHAKYHGENSQRYCSAQEELIDRIVAEILQEAKS